MKTLKQIEKKSSDFLKSLRNKAIKENHGQTELRKLKDFIGDIYDYDYSDRQEINNVLKNFEYKIETMSI